MEFIETSNKSRRRGYIVTMLEYKIPIDAESHGQAKSVLFGLFKEARIKVRFIDIRARLIKESEKGLTYNEMFLNEAL